MKPVTLTAEAAQQIEEALVAVDKHLELKGYHPTTSPIRIKVNKAIRASRAQDDHIGESNEMVSRPQNCGTGHCSCIECVMEPATEEKACSDHPDAPHGFDRNASHNAGHYVCDCEGWTPDECPHGVTDGACKQCYIEATTK